MDLIGHEGGQYLKLAANSSNDLTRKTTLRLGDVYLNAVFFSFVSTAHFGSGSQARVYRAKIPPN